MTTFALPVNLPRRFLLLAWLWAVPAVAQISVDTNFQDLTAVSQAAEEFLQVQLANLPGTATFTLDPIRADRLPECDALSPFLPNGAKLRSRMTVGVRCSAPKAWVVYIQTTLNVTGQYYVAANTIAPNQVIHEQDLVTREGDLLALPLGTITDSSLAIGKTASYRILVGHPIKASALRAILAVSKGQTVRVTALGSGFAITSEGQAMEDASVGSTLQVRMSSGQIVTGVVKGSGLVEIQL